MYKNVHSLNKFVLKCDGKAEIGGRDTVGILEMIDKSSGAFDAAHLSNGCYRQFWMLLEQVDGILHAFHLDIASHVGVGVLLDDGGHVPE